MLPSTWQWHENGRGSCTRSFLRPPYVRDFVKEGYLFAPWYEIWGWKSPLQSTKYTRLWRRVTPEVTGLPSVCWQCFINIKKYRAFINIRKSFININKWFLNINKSFSNINKSFININKSFININKWKWFSNINKWFININKWFININKWFININKWFIDINKWFININIYFLILINIY